MIEIKIVIAAHKKSHFPLNEVYLPIQVGRQISISKLDIQGDDVGENISKKNPTYCELTALYWAWKNLNVDYIGLCHYRRYFNFDNKYFRRGNQTQKNWNNIESFAPSKNQLIKVLNKYDIILAKQKIYPHSLEVDYKLEHIAEDFEILTQILKKNYPAYYRPWIDIMKYNNKLNHYNMFICKAELFQNYCEWLFSVLGECEKEIKLSPYIYQQRVFGFLAERLLLLYCHKNDLKSIHYPIVFIDENSTINNRYIGIKNLFKNFAFYLQTPESILKNLKNIFKSKKY
ncbi:MAG: DUF4422 domain-containing protein [Mariniphaga sp.]